MIYWGIMAVVCACSLGFAIAYSVTRRLATRYIATHYARDVSRAFVAGWVQGGGTTLTQEQYALQVMRASAENRLEHGKPAGDA